MEQQTLADLGHSNWRHTTCPSCGQDVAWTIATAHSANVKCDNEVGDRRSGKERCGFTLKRAEWDYIREKGPEAGRKLKKMQDDKAKAAAEKRAENRPVDSLPSGRARRRRR